MKTIYLDNDFKCHLIDDGTMISVETEFFNGMCDAFIEGYRFIPEGKNWVREDGEIFVGPMYAPWKLYSELDAYQREYEKQLIIEQNKALQTLGVEF
jgi:hypothetical protein